MTHEKLTKKNPKHLYRSIMEKEYINLVQFIMLALLSFNKSVLLFSLKMLMRSCYFYYCHDPKKKCPE